MSERTLIQSLAELNEHLSNSYSTKDWNGIDFQTMDLSNLEIDFPIEFKSLRPNFIMLQSKSLPNFPEKLLTWPVALSLEGSVFRQAVSTEGCFFEKPVSFKGSVFEDAFTTGGKSACVFNDFISFDRCRFNKEIKIENSVFEKTAYFISARFSENASFFESIFKTKAIFEGAQFHASANFRNTDFLGPVRFRASRVSEKIDFSGAKFFSDCKFDAVRFDPDGQLYFCNVQCGEKAVLFFEGDYNSCDASNKIVFTAFSPPRKGPLIRIHNDPRMQKRCKKQNHFGGKIIYFCSCHFQEENVYLTNFFLPFLDNDSAYGWKGFTFDKCQWGEPVQASFNTGHWHNWLINLLFLFPPLRFLALPDEKDAQDPAESNFRANTYAELKTVARASGDTQLASNFYFWQMFWSLQSNPKQFWNWVYLLTSAYGLSVARPLIFLFLCFFLSYTIYALLTINYAPFLWTSDAIPYLDLAFRGLNPFSWLPDLKNCSTIKLNTWSALSVSLVFFFQHAVALYLWFQLGAAIRSRVRQ